MKIFVSRNKSNDQRGAVTILISVIILSAILMIGLTIANIVYWSTESERLSYYSYNAFYAAEAGIEDVLYETKLDPAFVTNSSNFPHIGSIGTASYTVTASPLPSLSIKSMGEYRNTKRAIEIYYE